MYEEIIILIIVWAILIYIDIRSSTKLNLDIPKPPEKNNEHDYFSSMARESIGGFEKMKDGLDSYILNYYNRGKK